VLQHKAPYLNTTFFWIRAAFFIIIWRILTKTLYSASLKQDARLPLEQSLVLTDKMRRLSAPGMILFALTATLFSFDWLMSLEPHWFSTMFGVYFFAGCVVSSLAFITLIVLWLRKFGILKEQITVEHHHDLGKLLFAFTVFWAYIGFCQYMLIWYANLPEETVWFHQRWQGSWKAVSLLIVIGHFALPFVVLLARAAKRNTTVLLAVSIWYLFIHWVDIYWLIMPTFYKDGVHLSWIDLATTVGVSGIFLWWLARRFEKQPVMPIGDPNLQASLNFHNV